MRKGFFWQLANGLSIAAINLLFVMIMARFIPKEIHGTYAILFVINNFFFMFSQFGMGAALVQKKKLEKDDISKAFYLNLLISIVIYGLLFVGSGLISGFFDGKVASEDIRILGVTMLFTSFSAISISLLQREFRFKQIFLINFIAYGIAYLGIGAFMAMNDYGLDAFIYAQLVLQLLLSVVAFAVNPFRLRRVRMSASENSFFLRFGKDFTIIRLLSLTAGKIDKLILGKTVSLESLANFEKAQYLTFLPPRFLNDLTNGFMFSYFSRLQSDDKQLFRFYTVSASLLMLIIVHIAFIFFSLSSMVIDLFYGPVWLDIAIYLKVFVFATPFLALAGLSDALVRAKNRFKLSKYLKVVYIIALVVVTMLSTVLELEYVILLQVVLTVVYGILMNWISLYFMKASHKRFLKFTIPVVVSILIFVLYHIICAMVPGVSDDLISVVIAEVFVVGALLLFNRRIFTDEQRQEIRKLIRLKQQ